ncbi:MAG: hypothetical protein DHS20C21_03090 [Gemmatimonadota bacterium]|nr:MAG: hypothetical protein DHS20C21_03090 [Gemmatimonadota bacterium]
MPSCERCWAMSRGHKDPEEEYRRLLLVNDCTSEQQAGPDAGLCLVCDNRTVHQHTGQCISCGWEEGL